MSGEGCRSETCSLRNHSSCRLPGLAFPATLLAIEGRTVRVRPIERFSEQIMTGIVVPLLTGWERASFLLEVVRIIPGRRLQPGFLYFGNVKITTATFARHTNELRHTLF